MKKLGSGQLENQVLDVLWASTEPMTPRGVHERLGAQRELAYTTVMTILVRLWQKGVLDREPVGRAFSYAPRVTREERAATRMSEVLSDSGNRSLALTRFLDLLEPDQLADLREALRRTEDGR